jgi:hypothetical protein
MSTLQALNVVSIGSFFRFPKGNKTYQLDSLESGRALYTSGNDSIYDCPATHEVVLIALDDDGQPKAVRKVSKAKPKTKRKAFKPFNSRDVMESKIKGTTSVSNLKVVEARLTGLEETMTIIAASLKTQSEALKMIAEALKG